MGTAGRITIAVLALGVAGALFFLLRDGGGEDEPATASEPAAEQTAAGVDDGGGRGDGGGGQGEGKPEETDEPAAPEIPLVVVRDGEPVGGVLDLGVTSGDQVQLGIESDTGGYVHVHGYELEQDLSDKGTATLEFPATIEGLFEVELHSETGAHVPVAEISVNPG